MASLVPTPWRPTTISRFIRAFDTGAGAALVATDAGDGYLKAMGNPGGNHCLACEWVGSQLARWFELSTFDFALIDLAEDDPIPFHQGGWAKPGPAFITRAESGEPWSGAASQLELLMNPQDIVRLVVFDTWVRNCDRHAPNRLRRPNLNNVFLSAEAPSGRLLLKAMDHTHVFTCGHSLDSRASRIDRVKDDGVYGLFPGFLAMLDRDAFHRALDDLAKLPQALVTELVQGIPSAWEVNQEARSALAEFIVRRAQYLVENRSAMMNTLWLESPLILPSEREVEP